MKKAIATLLFCCAIFASARAQQSFFIGIYTKPESGTDFWCRNMEMEKQLVNTVAEGNMLVKEFKAAHAKESPVTSVVTGAVVVFTYERNVEGFKCKKKVIAFSLGTTAAGAQKKYELDRDRISKDYKANTEVIFAWNSIANATEKLSAVGGVAVNFKVVKVNGAVTTHIVQFKNPVDSAAKLLFIIDGVAQKTTHTVPSGGALNINLGKFKSIEMKLQMVPKQKENQSPINWLKHKIRNKWIQEHGEIHEDASFVGVRG